jgi:predicted dehydrogenase
MVKIGLFGLGHLGRIHLKCLKETPFELAGFYEPNEALAKKISEEHGIKAFNSPEELFVVVDAVDIVTPTTTHFSIAKMALEAGKHLFIEKPVTENVEEAKALIDLSKAKERVIQVGHVERYNPAFLAAQNKFSNPKFIEGHRLAIYNPRGTDVSVVLDLMIHDIDLVLSLVKSDVKDIRTNAVKILSPTADICNARIEFENGCVANLTASRISMKNMRKLRLFSEDAYVSIDFLEKESQIVRMDDAIEEDEGFIIDSPKGKKKITIESPSITNNNAIKEELCDFYHSIINGTTPKVSLKDGYNALKLATEIELLNKNNDTK